MPPQTESSVAYFDSKRFGEDLRRIREERDDSRVEVAKQLGINFQVIIRLEQGKNKAGNACVLAAFWADLDLRNYVRIKDPQQALFL